MGSHIATTDTFFIDSIKVELECPYCSVTSEGEIGWIGARCGNCKMVWNSEDTLPDLVRRMRERLKLSRNEMAKATGYKATTIKTYEWQKCSIEYWQTVRYIFRECIKEIK